MAPLHRGDWVPLIPTSFRWPILALWVLEPVVRGIDYVTGDGPNTTNSLTFVEQAMPLWAWGLLFLAGGSLSISGFLLRWPRMTILGLHIAGTTYAAMALGLTVKAVERGGDGFRTPVMFAVFALTFWFAAFGYLQQWRIEQATRAATTQKLVERGLIGEENVQ
ncbi:hypothetical protein GTE6_40 [Gordonia phage GTE6]|uniref:Uncharacterized protein n=2 Tax=Dexdertvirus TaxID=2948679 RepID=A0A0K0MWR3_9CAUD|nr:minor tail protein [Gordonia phage GTE6]YP_010001503.1 minor tail protein [Gordonia phage Tiamoceli]AKI28682.1 hypothetical protein GTE6_40 [Gordonia phage GTE6]QAY16785.1 hypothetical protein SEA_TIAMOCELI_41 [Gordonia phage Tiamoceli]